MSRYYVTSLILAMLILSHASADDIEIYLGDNSADAQPYVHLILDYGPGMFAPVCRFGPENSCAPPFMSPGAYSHLDGALVAGDNVSRLAVFVAVLEALLENPQFQVIRFSLGVSNFHDGGTILAGFKRAGKLSEEEADFQPLLSALESLPVATSSDAAHPFQPRENYFEWLRYINGGAVVSGRATSGNFAAQPGDSPVPDFDSSILASGSNLYLSPFGSHDSCPKLFSILWGLGATHRDDAAAPDLGPVLGRPAAELEHFLVDIHSASRDLVPGRLVGSNSLEKTWVIASDDILETAQAWALAGGSGRVLDIDQPANFEKALAAALRETISISSAVLAESTPANTFEQSQVSNALYIALFEPRSTRYWPGNIKKFRLQQPQPLEDAQVVDARGKPGLSASGEDKGRIEFAALSLWTDVESLPMIDTGLAPPGVDGKVVARGGAGQNIPGLIDDGAHQIGDVSGEAGSRALYIDPEVVSNGDANPLLALDGAGLGFDSHAAKLAVALGGATLEQTQTMVRWIRGQDVDDEDGDGDTQEARNWIMGGVLHSKPAALNYGAINGFTRANPNVRIFFGTGDGVLHSVENTDAAGDESGAEVFGFLPRELLSNIPALRADVDSSLKMRYGVDGSPVFLTRDNNDDGNLNWAAPDKDEAYLYFGLRRGGSSYYALDVRNPLAVPTLLWKISRTEGGQFDELGLTFSTPLVGRVKFGGTQTDVLIFAGGYHGGWDETYSHRIGKDRNADDDIIAGVSNGNAIYIVNARTGELVWKAVYGSVTSSELTSSNTRFEHAELIDSLPSSVSALKTPAGNIHRLYVGDTGGAVWRVDLPVGNDKNDTDHRKKNWFISKFAELGSDGAEDRRFFHAPDLVRAKEDSGEPFDGVLISSGNRAQPRRNRVDNYHFYLKDAIVGSGDAAVRTREPLTINESPTLSDIPDVTHCAAPAEKSSGGSCELSLRRGWMIKMLRAGEKGLATPLVDGGRVFFTSYVPAFDTCSPGQGQSFVYLVNLKDGRATYRGESIYPLGSGISSGVLALGEKLLTPLEGLEEAGCEGVLCDSYVEKLRQIYWREPGIDTR